MSTNDKHKYLLVRRNPNARDILMMFLQIQDQLNEIDGEFDGADEDTIDKAAASR